MEFLSPEASARYAALVRALPEVAVGLDFDGTLAPIVADPAQARIHPDAPAALAALAGRVRSLALVTGRPVEQVLGLGDLVALGARLAEEGRVLEVYGQYGNEHWTSTGGHLRRPVPPASLGEFVQELPEALDAASVSDAHVETKPLGIAVHTRRSADPEAAFERLLDPLADLAADHGLDVTPGRQVIEVRAPGLDKGDAVRRHAVESAAAGYLFAGDDLGDLAAAAAVAELRAAGLPTLIVCAASTEEDRLRSVSDVAVPGVPGVIAFLRSLTS
ncbi:trehalose-phosphatase [Nocardioides daejeonensis]|uniref:trehalose-phosphatase n=1 Tax=Nocardioides daejeonensis TaxID=1046556 RepID=UPI000D7493F7|nr:trehalose-phosphatase [Nocardioides daejeonensis]